MVNKEIHRSLIQKSEQARKIEIYRKNTSDLDKEIQEEPTKIDAKKPKINIFETFKLILGVTFIIMISMIILNTFFYNPFKELQKEATQNKNPAVQTIAQQQQIEEVQTTPTEPEEQSENFIMEKDGSLKLTNLIIIGVGLLLIFKLLIEPIIR